MHQHKFKTELLDFIAILTFAIYSPGRKPLQTATDILGKNRERWEEDHDNEDEVADNHICPERGSDLHATEFHQPQGKQPKAPHGYRLAAFFPPTRNSSGFASPPEDGDKSVDNHSWDAINETVRVLVPVSPRATSSPGRARSAGASGGASSMGSNGSSCKPHRKIIAVTPVWKRPAVPLTKAYVPVPRNDCGR